MLEGIDIMHPCYRPAYKNNTGYAENSKNETETLMKILRDETSVTASAVVISVTVKHSALYDPWPRLKMGGKLKLKEKTKKQKN